MSTESEAPKALLTKIYIKRFPAVIFGIIFAGMILLVACGGDAATATPSPTQSPAETATPSPTQSPTESAAPTPTPVPIAGNGDLLTEPGTFRVDGRLYTQEEISFDSNGVTLSGILMFPAGDDRYPLVILLSGSGADTRDFYGRMPFAANLAKEFGKLGYAVFSYDDRGVGKSGGDYWQATTEDHLSDVDAAILKLKAHPNVDSSEIGLLGHSFGAAIAPLVALRHPEVRFSILLATPTLEGVASKLDQVLFQMAAAGVDEATLDQTKALLALVLPIVRDGGGYEDIRSALAQSGLGELGEEAIDKIISDLQSQFPPINPNTVSFLNHDPGLSLGAVDIPVLVVFGELDHQVPAESNHSSLLTLLSSRESHAFTVEVWPQANHVFKLAKTGGQAEWGSLEFKFAPGLLDFIGSWVAEIE